MIDVDYNEYKATLEENMKLIQENHKLKEKAKEWQDISTRINEDNNRLNNIINETIEYINKNTINSDYYKSFDGNVDDLLEILKGE